MKISVLVLFLLVVAAAEETKVTLNFREAAAADVLEVIAKTAGVKVALDPEYAGAKITVEMKNVAVGEALAGIAKQLGAVVHEGKRILPAWKRDMLVKLEKTRVKNVDWKARDITFSGALQYARSVTGLNIALDPKLGRRTDTEIEMHVDGVSARSLLDLLCEPAGVGWDLRYGVVFVAPKERLKALPAVTPWKDEALPKKRVDLPFDGTKLRLALDYLAAATGEKFKVDPAAEDAVRSIEVTLVAGRIRVSDALAVLLVPHGLTLARDKDGAVVVSTGR